MSLHRVVLAYDALFYVEQLAVVLFSEGPGAILSRFQS